VTSSWPLQETADNNKQKERKAIMKTTNKTLIAALAGIALFAAPVQAQYKAVGDDGIAASPKVRAQLNERKARLNTATPALVSMACPKCKDEWVTSPNRQAKGVQYLVSGGVPVTKVARHLCAGCNTTITVEGNSKATKHNVATHTCASCGAELASCCSTSKNGVATKGMEKQAEIAPLK